MRRFYLLCALAGMCGIVPIVSARAETGTAPPEPDARIAQTWWSPHRNVWTPIGWQDHLFRFTVLYNGWVVAEPHVRKSKTYSMPYAGQGVLLAVEPSADGSLPPPVSCPYLLADRPDRGVSLQRWTDDPTPMLVTSWPLKEGLVLEERVFAHLAGGGACQTGVEPLCAWIRLSVAHVDAMKAPQRYGFLIQLQADHLDRAMEPERNLKTHPERAQYPRRLTAGPAGGNGGSGLQIVEPDARLRLACAPAEGVQYSLKEREPGSGDYYLFVSLPVRKGAAADLLLPMLPGERQAVESELSLGRDGALKQADAFWSATPATAAVVDTPEREINEAIRNSVRLAQIITETNPDNSEVSFLTGSWHYDALWATPTSMVGSLLLDPLGYHDCVARHIELFRKHQGTIKPPGPVYSLHPGYLASPRTLTSIDWLADHGAILHQICRHGLLTRDRAFFERWQGTIVKACEFIRDARAIRGHDGVPGVLPPAVATDRKIPTQSVWNVGWNYRGLTSAVRLLHASGHPRADEFAAEARDYRETFLKALRDQAETMPQWADGRGQPHRLTPVSLSPGDEVLHPFYLDAGPLVLVWSGLMDASDPLMRSTVDYFREGPNVRLYDPRGNHTQRPVLVHELSSCEPGYSWNVYHSWQLGDRPRFLEGMYSLLVGALSDQTYVSCESRHGIYGTVCVSPMLVDLIRLAVIDDAIHENELHLLRLVPKAWLRTDRVTKFENMPTEFGPMTLRFSLADAGRRLDLSFEPRFLRLPDRVVLHVPPLEGLQEVTLYGQVIKVKPGSELPVSLRPE